jgi:SHS2 domain-containing protein
MPYRYLEDIAKSDVAFEASGETMEELFAAASDATMNVMVEDLNTISEHEHRSIQVEADSLDMLLFDFLQELIFYEDAERLLLRVPQVHVERRNKLYLLMADAYGEELRPDKHELVVDVKAVTLHRFQVKETPQGWEASVILDI